MKIKDAITILESFKSVAGEDAELDVDKLSLVAKMEVQYSSVGYGYERDRPTYKLVHHVAVSPTPRDMPSQSEPGSLP